MRKTESKGMNPEELVAHVAELEKLITEMGKTIADQKKAIDTAAEEYAKLSRKLDAAEDPKAKTVFGEVKLGKVTYDIIKPKTRYGGVIYTAKELAANPELCEKLVSIEASILRKQ